MADIDFRGTMALVDAAHRLTQDMGYIAERIARPGLSDSVRVSLAKAVCQVEVACDELTLNVEELNREVLNG